MDYGHEQTDKELKKLERRLAHEYKTARDSVEKKIKKHLEQFSDLDAKYAKMVEDGKMSEKAYKQWRQSAMVRTDAWKDLRDTLASDLSHTNEIAMGMINDHAIDCYALNMNYGTYEIENGYHIGTSFSMYDHRTVENLMKDDPQIIPKAGLDIPEDKRWNRQKLTSAITQGILTGDSIPDIARRLGSVADMNAHAAVRNARTYTTAAENKGRTDSYERAQNMGIELEQEWLATLDQRTRSSHRHLDGERVKIGAKFSNGCRYPGDPAGRPEEIYNCFIADTSVATDCNIVRAYKHEYSGILLTIKTSGGINFTCTPNHPILTRRGWVHANMLNKGDDILVTCIRNKGIFGWNPHINHVFTRFDALFKAIDISGCERTRTLSVNFHGDIPASEVEIVTKKRFLRNNGDISGCKFVNKFLLKFSNKTLMCKRALMKHVRRIRLSLFGFMCRICKPFPFLVCGLRHSEIHGLRSVALLNSCGVQSLENNVSGNMELLRQSIDGFSGVIFSDNIVSVDVDSRCTHVYNLQSENGYYFVNSSIAQNKQKDNGIMAITKNCRCTLVAALKGYNYQDDRFSRLPKDMTYEEWKGAHETNPEYKVFKSGDDANAYFGQRPERRLRRENREEYDRQRAAYESSQFGAWYDGLTTEEMLSIGNYSGDDYSGINGLLRHQMTKKMIDMWNANESITIEDMISHIEKALNRFELQDPIKVFRTCENDVLENLSLIPGSTFHDDGFGSTSVISEKVASGNIVMEINVPAGKGYGAWINPLSGAQDEEYEFLLQRGSDYKVNKVYQRGEDTVVELDLIGNTKNDYSYATKEEVIDLWKKWGTYDEYNAEKI